MRTWLPNLLGAGAAVLLATAAQDAAARPMTAKDLALLDRISDPQLSPDGRRLVYGVRSTNWEANQGVNALWMLDLESPDEPPRPLAISDKPAGQARWSSDGKALYLISARSGSPQVWRTDAAGANALQVTNLPIGVGSFRLSPNGGTLVVALNVVPSCATLACTKAWEDAHRAGRDSGVAFDRQPLFVWDAWLNGERPQLFALPIGASGQASGEPVRLMKGFDSEAPARPFGSDADYAVTARQVIFSALPPGEVGGVSSFPKLWTAPLDGSSPPKLLRRTEGEYVRAGRPVLSPDGRRVAFLAQRPGSEEMRAAVMVLDLNSGAEAEADAGFDRSAEGVMWAPDGRTLYGVFADQGRTRLFAIDPRTHTVKALTGRGEVSGASAGGNRLIVARASLEAPAELYELSGGAERQLTHVNAEKLSGVEMSAYEPFSFAGWNGEAVHGYVVRPYGYAPGRKYPVAFIIHGGPYGSFGDGWSYRWNPQVWAGMGYAVVSIDFHGSAGYGEAFGHSIVGHWGDRPLEDLQKGWTAALAKYAWLDGDRACALGGSYGGYMVYWMAGAWNRPWKCFVDHDGIFDVRSMAMATDAGSFMEYEFGGPEWEPGGVWDQFNPLGKVGQWSKPILVVHSGRDYRVPLTQGVSAFNIAQRRGIPSRFLYFPDENHWVLKPQNSVHWYAEVQAWMERWLTR